MQSLSFAGDLMEPLADPPNTLTSSLELPLDPGSLSPFFGALDSSISCTAQGNVFSACGRADVPWNGPAKTVQWVVDIKGKPYELVNIYVHGSLEQLTSAIEKGHWQQAVPNTASNNVKYLGAVGFTLLSRERQVQLSDKVSPRKESAFRLINSMPVSPEFLCGKSPVRSFEKDNDPLGGRHHFRVFDTGQLDKQGRHVWAISAVRDIGIVTDKTRPKQLFLNHEIEKNQDSERDLVLKDLTDSGGLLATDSVQLIPFNPSPTDGAYSSDGRVYDVILR